MSPSPAQVHEIRCEVRVDAPLKATWSALAEDLHAWWHPGFTVGGENARMTLEARVGGRMWEEWREGEGVEWARVVGVKAPEMLLLAGHLFASLGGPSHVQQSFTLEEDDGGTLVKLHEVHVGLVSPDTVAAMEAGWRFLLQGRLKPHCEGLPLEEWTKG